MLSKVNKPFGPTMLLALLLLAMVLLNHWRAATSTPATDFFTYWGVPRVLHSEPIRNIYSSEGQRTIFSVLNRETASVNSPEKLRKAAAITSRFYGDRVDATGSPLLYALTGLLSSGDYEKDLLHYTGICFFCLCTSIIILCSLLKYPPVAAVLALIFFTSSYAPVFSDLQVGNTNQIQLFLVVLFILLTVRSQRFWAGVFLGIGIMFKPNIALIWLFYNFTAIVDREYKRQVPHLLGTLAGALLAAVFATVYFGRPALWLQFAVSLSGTLQSSYPVSHGNMSLPALLTEMTGFHAAGIIGIVLCAAFAGIVLATRRSGKGTDPAAEKSPGSMAHETFIVAGAGCTTMLLAGNLAWLHYFILLIPAVIYLLRPAAGEMELRMFMRTTVRFAAIAALLLFSTEISAALGSTVSRAVAGTIAATLLLFSVFYELWSVRALTARPQ